MDCRSIMSSTCKQKIKNYQFVSSRIFDALIRFIHQIAVESNCIWHVENLVVRRLIHCSLFYSICFKSIPNAFNCTRDDQELSSPKPRLSANGPKSMKAFPVGALETGGPRRKSRSRWCASVRPMFGRTLGCAENYQRDEAVDVDYCQFPQDSVKPFYAFRHKLSCTSFKFANSCDFWRWLLGQSKPPSGRVHLMVITPHLFRHIRTQSMISNRSAENLKGLLPHIGTLPSHRLLRKKASSCSTTHSGRSSVIQWPQFSAMPPRTSVATRRHDSMAPMPRPRPRVPP